MTQKYCLKCKQKVDDNAIRCSHCGMRLKVICPTCNTANLFGIDVCTNCGTVLLKYCENCGSANFPEAKECRKCHFSFEEEVLTFEKNRSKAFSKKTVQTDVNSSLSVFAETPIEEKKEETFSNELVESKIEQFVEETREDVPKNEDVIEVISAKNEEVVHNVSTVDVQENLEYAEESVVVNESEQVEDEIIADEETEYEEVVVDEGSEDFYEEDDTVIVDDEFDESIENQDIQQTDFVPDFDENEQEVESEEEFEAITDDENFEVADDGFEEEPQSEDISDTQEEFVDDMPVISTEELVAQSENSVAEAELDESQEIVFFDNAQPLLEQLTNIIQTPNNAVIAAICSEEGMGKSTVIKSFVESLNQKGIVPVLAECSESIKVSPFGTIRDFLLKLLTLPDLHPDAQTFFGEETKKLFEQNFETLSNSEIINFMNFLYPTMHAGFDSIIDNKNVTYNLLEKIFVSITTKNQAVFIIDDFDYIDNASFDFIEYLIRKQVINNNTKFFISYRERKSARLYFDKDISTQDIFTTMYLNNLSEEDTRTLIANFANTQQVPTAVNFAVNEKGKGNIFFTEQFLALLFDVGYMFINNNTMSFKEDEPLPFLPKNVEEIISLRFKALNAPELKDALITASILGFKFDKSAFAAIADITEDQTTDILQRLTDLMFIQPCSEYEYSFKNMTSWSVIFSEAHSDARFAVICKKVFYILGKYALSNPIIKASVAKYRDEEGVASQTWIDVSSLCGYMGDTYVYALALEQFLISSGYRDDLEEISDIQQEALEKIAKIIYKTDAAKAKQYLKIPIINARENSDIVKLIDLCGYMIKICYQLSDNNGVCETVDMIINTAGEEISALDKVLILSRKLNALFNEGNCEEGINLANNDILPVLEEELAKNNDPEFSQKLFTTWFDTSIALVKLYALQGNSKSVEIVENTAEILQMNNIEEAVYTIKLSLSKAFAYTVIGKIQESVNILKQIEQMPEYDNEQFVLERNLIFALNLVFSNVKDGLREILYEYAKYSANANDEIGKHIYKLMLAWLTYSEGEYVKSNNIFDEELTYYAQEKIVTGALISWLFIAKNALAIAGVDSAEHVAMKALEVAQNPKFSQYHITVYLQKLIAEINLAKGDTGAAKMYLEKGMLIAKQFGLDLAQIELYRTYVKFLESALSQSKGTERTDIVGKIENTYKTMLEESEKLKVPGLSEEIKNAGKTFQEML